MRYKNFSIFPVYCAGSNFKINKLDQTVNVKPKKENIEYYQIIDENGDEYIREFTIIECKSAIDSLILKLK
mgnify:CR=1 FL=1